MEQPRVQTQYGWVSGRAHENVHAFLGIPYAKPPVGPLRFLPPEPPAPWQGTRQADAYGDAPMQYAETGFTTIPAYAQDRTLEPPQHFSEDCLTLNIWRPAHSNQPLPVLFWIYGGAYAMGNAAMALYSGEAMAREGAVVVSANYRVGLFGFFAHPSLPKSATNAGLRDLLMALRWVQDNIAAFGGDPHNVTIQGESAGSAAVNTLLVCPQAKGLFHRAISQSFSPFNHDEWAHTRAEMEQRTADYLKTVGIDTLDQAYAAPAESLLGRQADYMAAEFSPYVDGDLLPEPLEQAFLAGHVYDVPVLLGCTANEATVLIGDRHQVTRASIEATFARKYPRHIDTLWNMYGAEAERDPAAALARFRSENTLANMRFYTQVLRRCNASPVYTYLFSRQVPGIDCDFYGSYHASEIPYHFGNLAAIARPFTPDDHALSQTMMSFWRTFAKDGQPTAPGQPDWRPYDKAEDLWMHLDIPCRFAPLSSPERTDFLQTLLAERTGL